MPHSTSIQDPSAMEGQSLDFAPPWGNDILINSPLNDSGENIFNTREEENDSSNVSSLVPSPRDLHGTVMGSVISENSSQMMPALEFPSDTTTSHSLVSPPLTTQARTDPIAVEPRHGDSPTDRLWLGQAVLVEGNEVRCASQNNGSQRPIGTYGLNGGTAIVILGKRGALVAHISPAQSEEGLKRVIKMYHNLETTGLHGARAFIFAPGGTGGTGSARRNSVTAPVRQFLEKVFFDELYDLGLRPSVIQYERDARETVEDEATRRRLARMGSLIVDEKGKIWLDQNPKPIN